jgi:predicted nucleotidyltransferase
LVSAVREISVSIMTRPANKAKSCVGADCAGDLVLPPTVPPRPRGTRPPPAPEAIAHTLESFCRRHGITRLEVFGSVARGDATVGSDVDLIATFPEHPGLAIVSIEEECEQLLGVPVHLLTFEAVEDMTNPYRRETIQRDRRTIYAYSRRRRRRAGRGVGSCAAARDADFVGPGARGG